jgi:hypothetical protein
MKTDPKRSKLPVCAPPLQGEGLIEILCFNTGSQILENIDRERPAKEDPFPFWNRLDRI